MDAIRFPYASLRAATLAGVALIASALPGVARGAEPLRDAPIVWHDDDRRNIPEPAEREPSLLGDMVYQSAVQPMRRLSTPSHIVRWIGGAFGGQPVHAASGVNAVDEVPNSSWFTNRIGLFPMTPAEVAQGSGVGTGPDTSAPWTVISAKTQGVTPGFNIRDASGGLFLIKFDPMNFPNIASAAGAVTARLFHAAGYNVPDDVVVTFERNQLVLGEGVDIKLPDGSKRPMTEDDLEEILSRVPRRPDGSWRAISSRFLSGKPIGPFNWQSKRKDDPNDRIDHQHRRVLRAVRVFAAWLAHFDTKQHNTLDMYVEEDGRHFVRHYLIDFASTLGTGATAPVPRYSWEYTFDPTAIFGRLFALGGHEDRWRRVERPFPEIGYFESEHFDPMEFKPLQPNNAFQNVTDRDGYWAAKVISAFTNEQIEAAVAQGKYDDPAAADYLVQTLAERRDKIARAWFERVPPMDFFRFDGGTLAWKDLAVDRGLEDSSGRRYRVRAAAVDADRGAAQWSAWIDLNETSLRTDRSELSVVSNASASEHPFVAYEVQLSQGAGWSSSTTAYVARASGRVVALDR